MSCLVTAVLEFTECFYCLTRFLSLKVLCQLAPNLVKSTAKYRCHLHCTGVHLSMMAAGCTLHYTSSSAIKNVTA